MRVAFALAVLLVAAVDPSGASAESLGDRGVWMILFQHDGQNTTGYVLYAQRDGEQEMRIDLGYAQPDTAGVVRLAMPPLTPGVYQLAVAAYNDSGESSRIEASPSRVTLDGRSAKRAAPPKPIPQAAPAARPKPAGTGTKSPADGGTPPASDPATPPPARPTGIFNRIWRVVAGSDNH